MKKYPFVKQDNIKDCGVASLLSIVKYYGGLISIQKLREMTKTNKNGTTAYHLIETAKNLGFESYGIRCKMDEFSQINFPAIAHTIIDKTYKHFVVIYDVDFQKQKITISDPMIGIKKMKFSEFEEIYNDILIIMYPIRKINYEKNQNIFLKTLKKQFLNKKIILILLMSILYVILNLMTIIFLKDLKLLSFCFFFILLKIVLDYIKNKLVINFNYKANLNITKEIFSKIIKLPYNFYRNITTGDMISRINDLQSIENMLLAMLISYFLNFNLVIASSILICFISFRVFIILFITSLLYFLLNKIFSKKIELNIEEEKISKEKLFSNLTEYISGFETIKGLNIEDVIIDKINDVNKEYETKIKNTSNKYNLFLTLKNSIYNFSNILILLTSLIFINNKTITINELIIINFLIPYFLEPLNEIIDNIKNLKEVIILIKRINELYYNQKKIENYEFVNTIEFKNVNYNNEESILKNINFKINNGEKIMVMGNSGSGKSTLLKLIKNYYKTKGVYVNDKENINNKNILYVSQNEILFTDTLYNNITLGRNVDSKEFATVIDICHINEIIKDKKIGYNMLIEENGFNISGGEKQRIVLARTLLTHSNVLLLDESLSEVDINLERKILKKLLKLNKTILLVSHRNNNLDLFDKLFTIKNKNLEIYERSD